jgi:hypothetical protein
LCVQGIEPEERDMGLRILSSAIRRACLLSGVCIAAWPALALDQPVIWRDPDTGCAYFLTPQGGVSPRFRKDGSPDCPESGAGSRLVDETARGFSQALDTLRREVERLRERFNDRP